MCPIWKNWNKNYTERKYFQYWKKSKRWRSRTKIDETLFSGCRSTVNNCNEWWKAVTPNIKIKMPLVVVNYNWCHTTIYLKSCACAADKFLLSLPHEFCFFWHTNREGNQRTALDINFTSILTKQKITTRHVCLWSHMPLSVFYCQL